MCMSYGRHQISKNHCCGCDVVQLNDIIADTVIIMTPPQFADGIGENKIHDLTESFFRAKFALFRQVSDVNDTNGAHKSH